MVFGLNYNTLCAQAIKATENRLSVTKANFTAFLQITILAFEYHHGLPQSSCNLSSCHGGTGTGE